MFEHSSQKVLLLTGEKMTICGKKEKTMRFS